METKISLQFYTLHTPDQIINSIMDTDNWSDFKGYGIIPGIQSAIFLTKIDSIKGSVIQVKNLDGSHHKEEIIDFEKDKYLKIKMSEFSFPLSSLSDYFIEEWIFSESNGKFLVKRIFTLYEKDFLANPEIHSKYEPHHTIIS